jgi:hypothetical protein
MRLAMSISQISGMCVSGECRLMEIFPLLQGPEPQASLETMARQPLLA